MPANIIQKSNENTTLAISVKKLSKDQPDIKAFVIGFRRQ